MTWRTVQPVDPRGQVNLGRTYSHDDDLAAYGYAEIASAADRPAQMAVGSDDTLTVWVNGKQVYDFSDRRGFEHEHARFDVKLKKGTNRVLIRCGNRGGPWQFSVAVTAPADFAFLNAPSVGGFNPEVYRAIALKGPGQPDRGRKLFSDLKGLACIKCHAVGKEGAPSGRSSRASPPSTRATSSSPPCSIPRPRSPRVMNRPRWPSPTAASSPGSSATRRRIPSSSRMPTPRPTRIAKDQIEERKRSDVSLMPNGLAEGLSPQDFADLIAYLETLKNPEVKGK